MFQLKFVLLCNGFIFKWFFVVYDCCVMKVGIDGILLGVWVLIVGVKYVLDIGVGSGLLVLMFVQCIGDDVYVEVVELDEEVVVQVWENVFVLLWVLWIEVWQVDIYQWQLL